jgi:hypothetical protein
MREEAMKQKRFLWPAVFFITVASAFLVFASARLQGNASDARASTRSVTVSPQTGSGIQYIRCAHLRASICDALKVLGNRFEAPGKERLTVVGSLTRTSATGVTDVVNIRLITEYPHLMRLEEQRLGQIRVLAFDGQQVWSNLGVVTPADMNLIQSIVFDSADHFFIGQMKDTATRLLGRGFRTDQGTNPNYSGPFSDIYQVIDQTTMAGLVGQPSELPKLYYLNTNTRKIERLRYQIRRATLPIMVQLSTPTWHSVGGQLVPDSIERLENGASVWKLTGTSWTLSPRADDGTFARPTLP